MSEDNPELGYQLVTGAATGLIDIVNEALDAGANVHFEDDLALRTASLMGNAPIVKLLVEKGANVNAASSEALLYAAKSQDNDLVSYLLSKGASIDMMMRGHRREVDQVTIDTLDRHESQKLRDAFEKNFSRIQKPETGDKFKLRKRPPSP